MVASFSGDPALFLTLTLTPTLAQIPQKSAKEKWRIVRDFLVVAHRGPHLLPSVKHQLGRMINAAMRAALGPQIGRCSSKLTSIVRACA